MVVVVCGEGMVGVGGCGEGVVGVGGGIGCLVGQRWTGHNEERA